MTSKIIPDDIWHCIAGFLPPDFQATLYSINTVLFDLSMNLRYRELDLAQSIIKLSPSITMASKLLHCHRYYCSHQSEQTSGNHFCTMVPSYQYQDSINGSCSGSPVVFSTAGASAGRLSASVY
ncbi:hypothetical protein C8J56DRAFT_970247 [Mycena floridula]|nr:hypothetical protein C8J56DRAFT_970247 [Mycena floridula]